MFAFPHRRTIHRIVLVTLAAWVLALMAGVANACVPQALEPSHAETGHAVEPGANDTPCHDAWDAGALTVAKQQGQDGNHPEAAAVPTIVRGLHPASVVVIDTAVDDGLHAIGPPGAIRFLRLRL